MRLASDRPKPKPVVPLRLVTVEVPPGYRLRVPSCWTVFTFRGHTYPRAPRRPR